MRQLNVVSMIAGSVFLSLSCGQHPMERKTSPLLENWKHANLITIELDDVDFPKAIEEFQRKTGIKFKGKANQAKITLKVADVPFWKGVAELSAAAKTSFFAEPWVTGIDGSESQIDFRPSSPSCDYYQLIGPFHIGLSYRGTKEEPLVLLEASSLTTDGHYLNRGIRKVFLKSAAATTALEQKPVAGDLVPIQCHWAIPPPLIEKPADLLGEMECQVYFNLHEIKVPLEGREVSEFKELGGFKVVTELSKKEKKGELSFTINWECGLEAGDVKKFDDDVDRIRKGMTRNEEEAVVDWLVAKGPTLRLLEIQKAELIDQRGKEIAPLERRSIRGRDVQGKISFENGSHPKELRLRVCERKMAIAVFEFKRILPGKWQ
jgi:hypothetical protein